MQECDPKQSRLFQARRGTLRASCLIREYFQKGMAPIAINFLYCHKAKFRGFALFGKEFKKGINRPGFRLLQHGAADFRRHVFGRHKEDGAVVLRYGDMAKSRSFEFFRHKFQCASVFVYGGGAEIRSSQLFGNIVNT
jgi:hypothetical protein